MAMRLDQALKLYIGLYCLSFLVTWFVSVPMLMHVSRNNECLLFVSPRVVYGPGATCFLVGLLPLFIALSTVVLVVLHVMQLRALKAYMRNPGPHSSKEYHNRPTHIFWRMVVFHAIVTGAMLVVTATVTAGYATTCQNLEQEVKLKVRARIQADQFGTRFQVNEQYDRYFDSRSINRYLSPNTDYYGRNTFERGITCRTILTDVEITRLLKSNHEKNPLYRQYNGFYDQNQVADVGNIRYYTYRDNLVLELAMAGSWICFILCLIILIMMVILRHHIRSHLTNESMWGGSEVGRRSISRISNQSFDRVSRGSNQSGSRYSASRARGSRAPSEQMSFQGSFQGGRTPRGPPQSGRHRQHVNGHVLDLGGKSGDNNLLSYFAENPPIDEEVDVDAALNDRSLEDIIPQKLDSSQVDGPKELNTSFGSEGLPVVLDHTQDPLPLGDEVSEGTRDVPITVVDQQPHSFEWQQHRQAVPAANPERITGRRGGGRNAVASRAPNEITVMQQFHHSSRVKYDEASPNTSTYRTQLGHQSLI